MSAEERRAALDDLRRAGGGVILPASLVEAASSPSHPFHSDFEWDDTEAARKYRLEQARGILRVWVEVVAPQASETRVFVSLSTDRACGGGYRRTVDVLGDEELRKVMLRDALEDLRRMRVKYSALRELAEVFSAIDRAQAVPV